MIQFSNQTLHEKLPFEQYLKLPGVSHSFLKYQKSGVVPYKEVTDKMRLGSMVDSILTEPDKVDVNDHLYRAAHKIAYYLHQSYGSLISKFKPQRSYSGIMTFNGMELEVCGRLDWELVKLATIDLKVTGAKSDREFRTLVGYMGYGNQLFNYAGLASTGKAYTLPYSTATKSCLSLVEVPVGGRNDFWERAILEFGRVAV